MPIIEQSNPRAFDGAARFNWFPPDGNLGQAADISANAYFDAAGISSLSIVPVDATQTFTVTTCGPAPAVRCNLNQPFGLLFAAYPQAGQGITTTGAPLHIKFSGNGVQAVGAFIVFRRPQVPFTSFFTPLIWVEINQSGNFEFHRGISGFTGDIWTKPGDSVAPFVGVMATGGDRISAVKFDASHPATNLSFDPLGIGDLFCIA